MRGRPNVSSRHQPTEGADSSYERYPYRVYLTDDVGARWWTTVSQAMGKHDARHQAIEKAHDQGYVDVTALKIERIPSNHHD